MSAAASSSLVLPLPIDLARALLLASLHGAGVVDRALVDLDAWHVPGKLDESLVERTWSGLGDGHAWRALGLQLADMLRTPGAALFSPELVAWVYWAGNRAPHAVPSAPTLRDLREAALELERLAIWAEWKNIATHTRDLFSSLTRPSGRATFLPAGHHVRGRR